MKRYNNLFDKVCDIDNIKFAHQNARKSKTWYKEVKKIDSDVDYYCNEIREMLLNDKFNTSEYEIKIINDRGKNRVIKKLPYYPDRIVQWAIMLIIGPILTRHFIFDSYSSMPKKGIHLAKLKIEKDIKNNKYALQLDVKKFYDNIDNDILKLKIRELFKDKRLVKVLDNVIDSDKGVPIGNYLSQYFANLYLTDLDHLIKENYTKYYYRYMDDILILGNNKEELKNIYKIINIEVRKIKLSLKKYKLVDIDKNDIGFCGYRFNKYYTRLRTNIKKSIKSKLKRYKNNPNKHNELSLNSVLGYAKHLKDKKLYRRVLCDKNQVLMKNQKY